MPAGFSASFFSASFLASSSFFLLAPTLFETCARFPPKNEHQCNGRPNGKSPRMLPSRQQPGKMESKRASNAPKSATRPQASQKRICTFAVSWAIPLSSPSSAAEMKTAPGCVAAQLLHQWRLSATVSSAEPSGMP